MLKISFFLKKLGTEQSNLEHITISSPKKISEGKLAGLYECEVYLSIPDFERKQHSIYSTNPADALCLASEFVKSQFQFLIDRGVYSINEVESKEPWKLEKKDPQISLQEKIDEIKNNKNISEEGKQEILAILKKTFGSKNSPIKDQVNKLV